MGSMRAWVGLDLGTSRVKAMAWSDAGHLTMAARPTPWHGSRLDGEELSRLGMAACEESVRQIPAPVTVAALGIASMGEAGLWVGPNGPSGPVVGWQDESATQDAYERFLHTWDTDRIYQRTGVVASAKFGLFRAMVGPRPSPSEPRTWLQVADWIVYRWTGGARVTHANLAARMMAVDWRRAAWDAEVLEFAGMFVRDLPEIVTAPTIAGQVQAGVSSLLQGASVVHAGQDHAAAYYGAGLPMGVALDSSGTAEPWVIEETRPVLSAVAFKEGIVWARNLAGTGFSGLLPTPAGGAAERWAHGLWGGEAERPRHPRGLYFDAEGFMRGRAQFIGIGPAVGAADLYDAVLFGVTASIDRKLRALREITGRELREAAWVGGAISHPRWTEIRKAHICARLWALEAKEATALGALLAAMAAEGDAGAPHPPRVWRRIDTGGVETPPWEQARRDAR